jgi:hypothetical protein
MAAAYPPIPRLLFGGAIHASLPVEFKDISAVRQVPDNQECWQDVERNVLFVFECLDIDPSVDCRQAILNCWKDLCCINESKPGDSSSFSFDISNSLSVRGLPQTAVLCSGVGQQRVKLGRAVDNDGNSRLQEERNVRVDLCLIRLPPVQTDLLLSLSTPLDQIPQETEDSTATFRTIVSSVEIRDWSLFAA